jgi:hypothetical protein
MLVDPAGHRESVEPTGAVGLADWGELAWPAIVVSSGNLAAARRELAKPTWSVSLAD